LRARLARQAQQSPRAERRHASRVSLAPAPLFPLPLNARRARLDDTRPAEAPPCARTAPPGSLLRPPPVHAQTARPERTPRLGWGFRGSAQTAAWARPPKSPRRRRGPSAKTARRARRLAWRPLHAQTASPAPTAGSIRDPCASHAPRASFRQRLGLSRVSPLSAWPESSWWPRAARACALGVRLASTGTRRPPPPARSVFRGRTQRAERPFAPFVRWARAHPHERQGTRQIASGVTQAPGRAPASPFALYVHLASTTTGRVPRAKAYAKIARPGDTRMQAGPCAQIVTWVSIRQAAPLFAQTARQGRRLKLGVWRQTVRPFARTACQAISLNGAAPIASCAGQAILRQGPGAASATTAKEDSTTPIFRRQYALSVPSTRTQTGQGCHRAPTAR